MVFNEFYNFLRLELWNKQQSKHIKNLDTWFNMPYDFNSKDFYQLKLPQLFIEVYEKTNGLKINWSVSDKRKISGKTHFLPFEDVIDSWENEIYVKEDLQFNSLLEYFHPFDLISDEAQCGIIIMPEKGYESIYYNESGFRETLALELDFKGYITMLYESKAYYNWPLAILHIINNDESEWLSDFKKNMKLLFNNFDWTNYVEIFESIRLDKKIKNNI